MKILLGVLLVLLSWAAELSAQSSCPESCSGNRSAVVGVASNERISILSDPGCSLRLVLRSPVRGEEMSISSGFIERNFLGQTFTAPFHKISDLLVLAVALQSDAMYPQNFVRGAKDSVTNLKNLEDDPRVGLRWSIVLRAASQSASDDKVSLRATWKNLNSSSGFSVTEVRLAPSHFTLWCR